MCEASGTDRVRIAELIRRVRARDERAAEELVRRFEPLIRREIRLGLVDPRLRRLFDSMDVCQSVLGSFFVRMGAGQYDVDEPGQLVRLLVAISRKKLASAARHYCRRRRDLRREDGGAVDMARVAGSDPSPSRMLSARELLERFRSGLDEEERRLLDFRTGGMAWGEIALRTGGTSGACRMQLSRAVERASRRISSEFDGND